MAGGVFLSSFAQTLPVFMLFYSLFFGVGVGIAYTAPIVAGWKWFPESKGLVSGAVLTGFGAGGFFFNLLGTKLINPNNEKPIKGAFSPSLTAGFGPLLRKLSACYVALAVAGSLLVSVPKTAGGAKQAVAKVDKNAPDYTPKEALVSLQFWWIWAIIFLMSSGSLATAGVNKAFGVTFPELRSDSYLSMVLALSALFNGGGRLFWGSMSDKYGFKNAFMAMAGVQALTLGVYDKLAASKLTFALGTMSVYFTLGGAFAMFPPAIQKRFGARNGVRRLYSVCVCGVSLSLSSFQLYPSLSPLTHPPSFHPKTGDHLLLHLHRLRPCLHWWLHPGQAPGPVLRRYVLPSTHPPTLFIHSSIPLSIHQLIHSSTHMPIPTPGYENVFKLFSASSVGALGLAALLPDN